ncbi:MAG: 50S ribosomal protein L20 [Candidatus Margulisbacteria bacterium GWF2_35_9]|nr:MAG: 50S ribosomal protein L20 [Candidatus Margulisbacteria bacterium GWF2_35_9]
MVRVKRGNVRVKRRKKILKLAKGFYGSLHRLYRPAMQAVTQALTNAFRGRREKKRNFRVLWIARINAAARNCGMSYSQFINNLNKKNVIINRKMLAEMAIFDGDSFAKLVEFVK